MMRSGIIFYLQEIIYNKKYNFIIKSWKKFNESIDGETEVTIDVFKYLIKKANIVLVFFIQ